MYVATVTDDGDNILSMLEFLDSHNVKYTTFTIHQISTYWDIKNVIISHYNNDGMYSAYSFKLGIYEKDIDNIITFLKLKYNIKLK